MGSQSPAPAPFQLPSFVRPSSLPTAAALSVIVHGGLFVFAVWGAGRWRLYQPPPAPHATTQAVADRAVTYVALGPMRQGPPDPAPGRPATGEDAGGTPMAPEPYVTRTALYTVSVPEPVERMEPAEGELQLRADFVRPAAYTPGATAGAGEGSRGGNDGVGVQPDGGGEGGATRVAELRTWVGNACPPLYRAATDRMRREFEVAVAFVVDTFGVVDRSTLRVVQAPRGPRAPPEFFPHIYVVGTTARVVRGSEAPPAVFDSAAVDAVIHHVAVLRFWPASRNGRPSRSTVLVSCQAR